MSSISLSGWVARCIIDTRSFGYTFSLMSHSETTTTTTTVTELVMTIKAAANLVCNYWYLRPGEIVYCAHIPCGVNGQCDGVLVLRLPV